MQIVIVESIGLRMLAAKIKYNNDNKPNNKQ